MKTRLFKFLFPKQAKELERITAEHHFNTKMLKNANADLRQLVLRPDEMKSLQITMRIRFADDMEKSMWAGSRASDKLFMGLFGGGIDMSKYPYKGIIQDIYNMSELKLTLEIVELRNKISREDAREIENRYLAFDLFEKMQLNDGLKIDYNAMQIIELQAIGERIEVLNANGRVYD